MFPKVEKFVERVRGGEERVMTRMTMADGTVRVDR